MGVPLLVYPEAGAIVTIQIAETDVNPVVAGGDQFGWVIGTLANLAPSAQVNVVFDLGPLWFRYTCVAACFLVAAASSGLNGITVFSSDTATINQSRRLEESLQGGMVTLYGSITSDSPQQQIFVKPMGRFLIIATNNADSTNAQGASATVTIAAYPS